MLRASLLFRTNGNRAQHRPSVGAPAGSHASGRQFRGDRAQREQAGRLDRKPFPQSPTEPSGLEREYTDVRPIELALVERLGQERMGSAQPGLAVLQARVAKQHTCLEYVMSNSQVSAFSLAYSLEASTTDRLLRGELRSGKSIEVDDLAPAERGTSIYFGALVSAAGQEMQALRLAHFHLSKLLQSNPAVAFIFGRVATASGERLMGRLGFKTIVDNTTPRVLTLDARMRATITGAEWRAAWAGWR